MKSNKEPQNYLDKIPVKNESIGWNQSKDGLVTLEIENKGFFNTIAQKLFKKPKTSFVHLDENGSFIWPLIDGKKNVADIGVLVKEHFGENCEPLYERLSKFLEILKSYNFISYK